MSNFSTIVIVVVLFLDLGPAAQSWFCMQLPFFPLEIGVLGNLDSLLLLGGTYVSTGLVPAI